MMAWRIPQDRSLLIVSDVDGTLLDDRHCLPMPVESMRRLLGTHLNSLAETVVLAFASSRTLIELRLLQRLLGVHGPLIAEDGGRLAIPRDLSPTPPTDVRPGSATDTPDVVEHAEGRSPMTVMQLGEPAVTLRARLRATDPDGPVVVLADMSAEALAARGFRTSRAVRRAITSRQASVLLDLDPLGEGERAAYVASAREAGVDVRRGGRWHTAVRDVDKGRAVRALREAMALHMQHPPFVVSVGNEENDVALLEQSDLGFVIRNPGRGHHPALMAVPGAVPLDRVGNAGFLEVLEHVACDGAFAS